MAIHGHLSRAPVAEAILDVQILTRPDPDPLRVRQGFAEMATVFPTQKDWSAMRASFTTGPARVSHSQENLGLQGVLLASADEKLIARATVDGLSLSRLQPYTSWDDVLNLFMQLWERYVACSEPQAVKRAAVRYINRLELPASFDLARILDIPIEIPEAIQGDLVGYFSRYVIESRNSEGRATLSIAIEPGSTPETSTLIFDIDSAVLSPQGVDAASIQRVLGGLREFKNRIFFGSFTDYALEAYR